jgi:thiol-disulfide isomerase/thioredoxin
MRNMRHILSLVVFILIATSSSYSQGMNRVVPDPETGSGMLVGYCDTAGLFQEPFTDWFRSEYERYTVDHIALDKLNADLFYMCEITVVLGTWCPDSRREVPRFLRIIDELGMELTIINMICVDRSKQADTPELAGLNIEKVPTFIFYLDGEEMGRIIEAPEESLEADMVSIFE